MPEPRFGRSATAGNIRLPLPMVPSEQVHRSPEQAPGFWAALVQNLGLPQLQLPNLEFPRFARPGSPIERLPGYLDQQLYSAMRNGAIGVSLDRALLQQKMQEDPEQDYSGEIEDLRNRTIRLGTPFPSRPYLTPMEEPSRAEMMFTAITQMAGYFAWIHQQMSQSREGSESEQSEPPLDYAGE